ncbi:MAG: ATP-binding protein [Candidatus Competibacteraceae bacterium]
MSNSNHDRQDPSNHPDTMQPWQALAAQDDTVRQAERLFSIGTLAGGIIHEINNPLNAILINAELGLLFLEKEIDRDKLAKILGIIIQEAKQAGNLTRSVLDFSKMNRYAPRGHGNLNKTVFKARNLAGSILSRLNVKVDIQLDETLPELYLNQPAIEQALAHLIVNAAEAGATQIRLITAQAENYVTISVIDNGAGIPAESMQAIFEPFFTTRQAQHKIGLGLSLVRRIVADHNGEINVQSSPGDTRFVVRLPLPSR